MDLVPLLFLLVIVFASGGIALVADHLGRKLGKKRLWLKLPFLHMRPKHTAQTGVFLSGVCVSFLTIVIVAGLSSDVRTWILKGRRALIELQVAEDKVTRLQNEGAGLSKTNQSLQKNLNEGKKKLGEQTKTISDQTRTLADQQTQINDGSQRIARLQEQSRAAQGKIRQLNTQVGRIQKDYTRVNKEYATATKSLSSVRVALKSVQDEMAVVSSNRDAAVRDNGQLTAQNLKLVNSNRELENSIAKLQGDIARLDRERETLERARQEVQKTLDETLQLLSDSEKALDKATQDFNAEVAKYELDSKFLKQTFVASREESMTYERGQEVARVSVPAGATAAQAKMAISELIKTARKQAAEHGAKSNGDYDAADIIDHFDRQMGRRVTAQEIEASLIRQLTDLKDPQVIVGSSSLNAFAGEPVSLEVSIYPNPLVYKQGQVVAEAKVDGKRDQSEIFRQVETLLAQRVAERAKQDKMIPLAGTAAGFGVVTRDEILDVMDRVRRADRKVTLRAIAEVDTRAGDPLKLRFGIR